MFESDTSWLYIRDESLLDAAEWQAIWDAAHRGGRAVAAVGRRIAADLDPERADAVGARLASLVDPSVELDAAPALIAACSAFGGPRTTAAIGAALRAEPPLWAVEPALGFLRDARTEEAAIQLRLCARDANEPDVLLGAHRAYRGWTSAMLGLLYMGRADAPLRDVERYFALNLADAMIHATRFSGAELRNACESAAGGALSRVIWAAYDGRRTAHTFRWDPEESEFVGPDCDPIAVADERHVGVVHTAELSPEDRDAWGVTLADFEIVTLVPQLDRPHLPARDDVPYGWIGRRVPRVDAIRFLAAAGWTTRGDGSSWTFSTRGSVLELDVGVQGEEWDLRQLRYRSTLRPSADVFRDIAYSETHLACVALLAEFAPDLL